MNSKMTTNSQLSTTKPKKKKSKNKNKLSKLEQEQNHGNGDYMECYQQGGEGMREKVQGMSSINGR